eukprot:gene14403-14509_t
MKRVSSIDALTASGNSGKLAGTFNRAFGLMSRRVRSRAAATAKSWSLFAVDNIHRAAPKKLVSSTVSITRQLSKTSLQMLNAVANMTAISQQGSNDDNLSFDLDWQPSLSLTQEVICWSCAAVAACLMYIFTAPAGFSIVYATCIGLVFGLVLNTLRSALLEEMYKAREKIEADLGDADSRFRQINNLQVHVKVANASSLPPPAPTAAAARLAPPPTATAAGRSGPVPALHCYHGFGSNTWSWSLVQKPLADKLRALVTSHDMPGFGLTQRPNDLSGYYLAFNGRLGRLAMDYELAVRGLLSRAEAARSAIISKLSFKGGADEDEGASASSRASQGQAAIKLEMLQDGSLFTQSLATGDDRSFQELLNQPKDKSLLGGLLRKMLGLAQTCSMLTTVLILSALRPAIVMVLRNVVRSRKFWANSLKQAYYDKSKVTPAAVDAYRMPQLVRGWETGMVQFLLARLGAGGQPQCHHSSSSPCPWVSTSRGFGRPDLPVLIVHGAGDKLVPVSNSFNLARLIKNCRLAVVKKAGHCPQEEQPELFTDLV